MLNAREVLIEFFNNELPLYNFKLYFNNICSVLSSRGISKRLYKSSWNYVDLMILEVKKTIDRMNIPIQGDWFRTAAVISKYKYFDHYYEKCAKDFSEKIRQRRNTQ